MAGLGPINGDSLWDVRLRSRISIDGLLDGKQAGKRAKEEGKAAKRGRSSSKRKTSDDRESWEGREGKAPRAAATAASQNMMSASVASEGQKGSYAA